MFHPHHDFGAPTGGDLLAELGVRPELVREVSEDERSICCPDRGAAYSEHGFAGLSPEPSPDRDPGQALPLGLHEAAEPWDPASSLPPADWRRRGA